MMTNAANLPAADRTKFNVPISEKKSSRIFTQEQKEALEFMEMNHSLYIKYLAGKWLDDIMMVYADNFFPVLQKTLKTDIYATRVDWETVELNETMRRLVFYTSVTTFFGTRLGKLWPNMWEDWRVFNDAIYTGVRSNLSFYLQPTALVARETMLKAFDRWVDYPLGDWQEVDGVWNEEWGTRMNWERERLTRKFGFTHRGRACVQAGFLFV